MEYKMEYGPNTWLFFSALTRRNLEVAEKNGKMILRIPDEDFELQMRRYGQVLDRLLEDARRPHEKKKELAERLQVDKSVLSAALSEKNPRELKRDIVLAVLFMLDPLPTVDQVNHKLMELARPGLYTETAFIVENRRNWVLYHILEYAQDHSCPVDGWLEFANIVLQAMDMKTLVPGDYRQALPDELGKMLEHWREETRKLEIVDFSVKRNAYLKDYRCAHKLDKHGGKQLAIQQLHENTGVGLSAVANTFGRMSNKNSYVPPETLVPVMAEMGCTLSQVNEMLLQANRELVYETSCTEYDLKWIKKLVENTEKVRNG